jgi:hypothetical protein
MKPLKFILPLSLSVLVTILNAQVNGCRDPLASNYNAFATNNDGSCMYNNTSIAPTSNYNLNNSVSSTSGLIVWGNHLCTHNDSNDSTIYELDTANGNITKMYPLTATFNDDWEEISQDDNYVYLGDFGNSSNGNRTNLIIVRISKISILANTPVLDTIHYTYSNQTNFTPTNDRNTDFDCEAFIVSSDSIFLFTKQWISNKTSVYSLPKMPGTYVATLKTTFDVQGLITGATFVELKKLIVLCGYSKFLQPFIYLLYDYKGNEYFSGNKRKINLSLPFHQTEGIATTNGIKYYISNEYLNKPPIATVPQQLNIFNLAPYLSGYLGINTFVNTETTVQNDIEVYPVPASDVIYIKTNTNFIPSNYSISNLSGKIVLSGKISNENYRIDISNQTEGIYILSIDNKGKQAYKIIKGQK